MSPLLTLLMACEPDTIVIENYIETDCCCDDTGDTIIDDTGDPCADFTAPTADEVDTVSDCIAEPDPIAFIPEVEWTWAPDDAAHPYNQVMVTPVVGNLTDDNGDGVINTDDTPDVVFTAYADPDYGDSPGALVILDGDTGSEQAYYTSLSRDGTTYTPQARGGVALGDIDSDGTPEICFPTTTVPLICAHADGTVVLVGDVLTGVGRSEWISGFPIIGDMDGKGTAEIAIGRAIWDSTGALLGTGSTSHGGYVHPIYGQITASSVMSDLNGDGAQELVAGNVVYASDGSQVWSAADAENGYSAVGDVDLDGSPDVVTSGAGTAYILDSSGNLTDSFSLVGCSTGGTCGPPTIADFDADGEPEIGIAGSTAYTVYDNASGSWSALWSEAITDGSGGTSASVFDFEADGEAEVVFADEARLYIWSGSDGSDRLGLAGWDPTDHASGTGIESPSLADIDNDGSTEILLASNELFSDGWFGVRAIGSGSGEAWAPSRPVWNQHSYHITNVNDDLSIPTPEVDNWTVYNNFRAQDQGDRPGSWLPDLRIAAVEHCEDCDAGESTFYIVVENQGLDVGVADVVLSVDGTALVTESVTLSPQQSEVLGSYTIDVADWTGILRVDIDPADDVEECDEDNNDYVVGELPCR